MKPNKKKIALSLPKPLEIQPEELEVLSPRKKISVSECALKNRILSASTTEYDGQWSHDLTPWAVRIMDSLSEVGIKQVTVRKSVQSAGTEIGLNFLDWIIEESPGPTLIVMPREDDTNRRVNTRIKPMFKTMPSLKKHLPDGKVENINIGKETVLDNMILFLGWSGSPAALADNPVCYVWLDEVGKFPKRSKKEADSVSLSKDRQLTFFSRAVLYCVSTPVKENDLIDREYKDGDMEWLWFRCPFCRKYHKHSWSNVQMDKDEEKHLLDAKIYERGGHSRYVCPNCKKGWTEKDRWEAVTNGVWCPEGCRVSDNGRITGKIPVTTHRSFQVTAMMLYPAFMTIDRMTAKWSKAIEHKRRGDIGPLQDFINSYLGEPFEEREKETHESVLVRHIGTYESGTIPVGVQMITAGFDVQLDHIWYGVLGWGYMSEVWSITEGRLETGDTRLIENYELVERILAMRWPFVNDKKHTMGIYKAAIDCNYRMDVVIDLCQRNSDILMPVRGDDNVRNRVFRAVKISEKKLIRYDLNTNVLKDRLHRLLYESVVSGPGYMHLNADTTDEIIGHLSSEEQRIVRSGRHFTKVWVLKENKQNHLWDVDVYATAAAELAGVRFLQNPEQRKIEKSEQISRQGKRSIRTRYN